MTTVAATVVETPPNTRESTVEKSKGEVKNKLESGDISGVYRIAQAEVDDELARGLGLSKIESANTATIAGPEIVALKQADADFENRAKTALGGLKTSMDSVGKPTETEAEKYARLSSVAEKAMAEGPLTVEEMAKDLEKHVTVEEAAIAIPLTEVKKTVVVQKEDPVIRAEELPQEEQDEVNEFAGVAELDEGITHVVTEYEKSLEHIDAELAVEKKALEEFNGTHGMAHTPLEQAYNDALKERITALEHDKKSHESNDESFEAKAKQAELKQKADKAEATYQAMYDGYINQPVTPPNEQIKVETPKNVKGLHLNEEDIDYEAQQYQQFHPGQSFGSEKPVAPKGKTGLETAPMSAPPKPKGRMGKFIDNMKFWRFFTRKNP